MTNAQEEIITELLSKLAAVPEFGGLVFEDSARRVLDAEDPDLPDSFIILQPGETREVQRVGPGSLRESMTVHIVLVTRKSDYGPRLRAGRLQVKRLLSGRNAGLSTKAVQSDGSGFEVETLSNPDAGQRMAAHAMTLKVAYIQNYA